MKQTIRERMERERMIGRRIGWSAEIMWIDRVLEGPAKGIIFAFQVRRDVLRQNLKATRRV